MASCGWLGFVGLNVSVEIIELRESGEWPSKFTGDADPDVQLERLLDTLHAEIEIGPTTAQIRGLINIEVEIPRAQSDAIYASLEGRGLR